ncbi:hypothetical protein Cs308_0478 [Candidatus Chlamydia sanziniae]|uniref:Effector from type III secretion system family protein n=2 Tax=Candidatus Chlamydia sanziniae TaxID=1806891 RepID=A0A1A9HUI4_9CHLA|nr:hypothetical protein Cs308_0478 [Candidatus Chlamydia sanziniae]
MNPRIERLELYQPTAMHTAASGELYERSSLLALEYIDVKELSHHLQVLKEVIKEARSLGLGRDFVASMNRSFLDTGVELAIMQTMLTEENNRDLRKRETKMFHQSMRKDSPKILITAPELSPTTDSVINKMPFQSAFAYILLDKYIPQQEQSLYALGRELNLAGYAQNLFSPLLEAIKTFNSAPINYNLGSYISQTSDTANFKYGYQMILSRYDSERAQLRNDVRNVENTNEILNKIRVNINDNASLTTDQKTQLLGIATTYQTELKLINEQLKDLMRNLDTLIFIPGSSQNSPAYTVMGADFSITKLQDLEHIVVDGVIDIATATAKGGLLNFFTMVLMDVQNYGDLAQTQQLMLDLELKAMQQQWSLVSASLKLMHGIYKTLIAGFKR